MNCTVMGRMCPYYVYQSVQSAHVLVPVFVAANHSMPEDPVLRLLEVCRNASSGTTDAVEAAVPGYARALSTLPHGSPAWLTTNRSGTYGQLYSDVLTGVHGQQMKAAAVTAALCAQTAPVPTSLVGMATVQLEKGEPGARMRYMTTAEQQAALLWCAKQWEADVQELAAADPPAPLRGEGHGERVALLRHVLGARSAADAALLSRRRTEAMQAVTEPPSLSAWALDVGMCLHLTAVIAHPDAPSAGCAALQKVCAVADELGMPVMLEALPSQMLPTYYARFGFRLAAWDGKACTEATFAKQGWVYMWRLPGGEESRGGGSSGNLVGPEERVRFESVYWNNTEQTLTSKRGRRTLSHGRKPGKLEDIHLSVDAATRVATRLVWLNKKESINGKLSLPFCWAAEYVAQVQSGRWLLPPFALPEAEALVPWTAPLPPARPLQSPPLLPPAAGKHRAHSSTSTMADLTGEEDEPPRQRARAAVPRAVSPPARSFAAPVAVHSSPLRPMSLPLGAPGSMPGLGPHAVPVLYIANFSGTLHVTWNGTSMSMASTAPL